MGIRFLFFLFFLGLREGLVLGFFWVFLIWVLGSCGLGEPAVDVEKSKAVGSAMTRSKKRPNKLPKSNPKAAWGKLLSQYSQVGFWSSVLYC